MIGAQPKSLYPNLPFLILIFLIYSGIHVYLGSRALTRLSPTFDEPVHLTAGYIYWTKGQDRKNYRYNGYDHPPFAEMWAAIPLLFLKPELPVNHPAWQAQNWHADNQYRFADEFLYRNRVAPGRLMATGRAMQLVMSLFFGAFLALFLFLTGGLLAAVYGLGFWAFDPTFLASSTLVTTDLAFACSFFAFFAMLPYTASRAGQVGAGVALGLCLASKYFCIGLGPCLAALFVWQWIKSRHDGEPFIIDKSFLVRALIVFAIALFVLALVYRFAAIETFYKGLRDIVPRARRGFNSYFWGRYGDQGWLLYFPFAFLIKSPIPLLIGLVATGFLAARKKFWMSAALVIPPLVFFLLTCLSKKQIGQRYLLAVYPFLYVAMGIAFSKLHKRWHAVPLILLAWMLVESWQVKPHFLAYFNQFVGGPPQGYKYLTDSNVDWGQGLIELREKLSDEDIRNGIYLSYFGVGDPHAYGIKYIDVAAGAMVPRPDDRHSPHIKPRKFVISVSDLQTNYYAFPGRLDWLKDYSPFQQVGYSLLIYDFSDFPQVITKLDALKRTPV